MLYPREVGGGQVGGLIKVSSIHKLVREEVDK